MVYYLVRRLLLSMLVILATAIFLAALVHLIPGDPVTLILGPRATAAKSAQVRSEMELDKSVAQQVTNFVWRAARGDLGRDFASGRSVTSILAVALPHTGILAVVSLALAALIGLPLGVYSATHPHSWTDRLTAILAISFITMPSYLAGQFLLLIFAVYLGWLPAIGTGELSDPVDYLRHLLLPAVALAVTWIGYLARLVRASMLEVLSANYIRTALAYGLSDRVIYYRHALKTL
jgi:peptide/nickel transport system permease protein